MAFAAPTKNKQQTTNLAKSSWTPMGNPGANLQVFDERRALIKKWFEKWSDKQRRVVVDDILKSLSEKHLLAVHENMNIKFPQEKFDFTMRLPRVLSLYVFSFLDPRSLSRCAQVSWYWKYLTELDCVWRPKCLRFGWYPTHQPSQYEETIWKRYYIETIHKLNYVKAKETAEVENPLMQPDTARTDRTHMSSARSHMSSASTRRKRAHVPPKSVPLPGPKWEPPPWKGSDPHPTDTVRYNYLDNQQKAKSKNKNPRRPKSASGSVVSTARKSVHSPLKSSMEPRPSSGAPFTKSSSVTQSFDPQALSVQNGRSGEITMATTRNMMSASVSSFAHTGTGPQFGSSGLYTSTMNGGATLNASTYYVDSGSPQRTMAGTLDASTYYTNASGLNRQIPDMTSSPQQAVPTLSPLSLKDAGKRPQPIARLSTDKSLDLTPTKQQNGNMTSPLKSDSAILQKQVAMSSEYQVKPVSKANGKSTPLLGSPWKPPEVISDEDE